MKIQFKRIVSAICALALCASMVPASALAEENSPATYSWGGSGNRYVWNVATIEKKGDNVELSEADGSANTAEHVTVETSANQQDWEPMTAGESDTGDQRNDRYIKVTAVDGYYIQTIVVACNDNQGERTENGFNCRTAYRGASYFAAYDVNENSVILDTNKEDEEGHAFYHGGRGSPYHVLIQVAESPNPVCVVYDAGTVGDNQSVADAIEGAIVTAAGGTSSVTDGSNVAVWYEYEQDKGQSHTVLEPSVSKIAVNGEVYQFAGWELEYFQGSNTTDTDQFPSLSGMVEGYGTTVKPGNVVTLSTYAKLTAQWKKVTTFTGDPIYIEVYLDGELQSVAQNGNFVTISTEDTTAQPVVSTESGKYKYDYKYETFNCADIGFSVDSGYVLQAVEADLVYGSSGSKGITGETSSFTIDNVTGGSTVKLYLATAYNVKYYVDSSESNQYTDSNTYTAISGVVAALTDNTASMIPDDDMANVDKTEPSNPETEKQQDYGVVKKFAAQDTITMLDKEGIDGWYKEAGYDNRISDSSLQVSAVIAAGSGYTIEGNTIQFFGRTRKPDVAVTKEITKVERNGETFEKDNIPGTLQVGDVVTYTITVENTGNVALSGLTVTDTFEGSGTPVHVSGFTISWGAEKTGTATIASLAVGAKDQSVYKYTVLKEDAEGTVSNTVSVTGGDDEDPVEEEDGEEKPVGTVTASKTSVKSSDKVPAAVENAVKEAAGSYTKVAADEGVSYVDTVTGNVVFLYKVRVNATFAGAEMTVTDAQNEISATSDKDGVTARATIQYVGSDKANAVVDNTSSQVVTIASANDTVDLYYMVQVRVTDSRENQSEHYTITIGNTAKINNNGTTEDVPGDSVEIRETDKSVQITKKITAINGAGGKFSNSTVLHAGDQVTYTVTVKNTSTVALENIQIRDAINGTQAGLPAEVTVGGQTLDDVTWALEDNVYVGKWNIARLDVNQEVTATYTYTVQTADESTGSNDLLTNRASVPGADTETGEDTTQNFVEKSGIAVDKTSSVRVNDEDTTGGMLVDYTIKVTNKGNSDIAKVTLKDAMFPDAQNLAVAVDSKTVTEKIENAGGTLTITLDEANYLAPGKDLVITYTCQVEDEDLTETNGAYTLYNKVDVTATTENGTTAEDDDEETTTVYAGELTLTPAPIVIYPGGTSGQDIVNGDGAIISDNLDLPVLGFLFTDGNDTNISIADHATLTLYDVSGKRNGNYSWTASAYNGESTVLYRLDPTKGADNTDDVRIQLTDEENHIWTSDEFVVENYLYKEFTTDIYTNLPDNEKAAVVAKVGDVYYKLTSKEGTLTVRGTTGQEDTNPVAENIDELDKLQETIDTPVALVNPDAKYYYVSNNDVTTDGENTTEGKLQVVNTSSVSLLVDEIVDQTVEGDQQYVQMMKDKVEADNTILGAVPADTARVWRFYYMDLVLADNGNAVLTTDKDVDIYWPYPSGVTYQDVVSGKYSFTVLHYTGLDRNYESENFTTELGKCIVTKYDVTPTENGLKFTVPTSDGFSPYALVYQYSTKGPEQTVTATSDDHPDIAEAIANGTWGQPTPTPAAAAVIPQTSDDMPLFALMGVAAAAAVALVTLVVVRRRRRNQ